MRRPGAACGRRSSSTARSPGRAASAPRRVLPRRPPAPRHRSDRHASAHERAGSHQGGPARSCGRREAVAKNRRSPAHRSPGAGLQRQPIVELRGFEPLTPSMPWRCATNCATAPLPGSHRATRQSPRPKRAPTRNRLDRSSPAPSAGTPVCIASDPQPATKHVLLQRRPRAVAHRRKGFVSQTGAGPNNSSIAARRHAPCVTTTPVSPAPSDCQISAQCRHHPRQHVRGGLGPGHLQDRLVACQPRGILPRERSSNSARVIPERDPTEYSRSRASSVTTGTPVKARRRMPRSGSRARGHSTRCGRAQCRDVGSHSSCAWRDRPRQGGYQCGPGPVW
jgi:hypothetical protein